VTPTTATNYALYQTGWFACILGAAWGHEYAGVSIAIGLMALHLWLARERGVELRLMAFALGVGLLVESVQVATHTYDATSSIFPPGTPPAWLLVLWTQFATTFRYSLNGIVRRPLRAALFGALGGPLAFLAADRLEAISLLPPVGNGLGRISVLWTVALLLFSWLTQRSQSDEAPVYRHTLPGR
jgi:hypothetical protein